MNGNTDFSAKEAALLANPLVKPLPPRPSKVPTWEFRAHLQAHIDNLNSAHNSLDRNQPIHPAVEAFIRHYYPTSTINQDFCRLQADYVAVRKVLD